MTTDQLRNPKINRFIFITPKNNNTYITLYTMCKRRKKKNMQNLGEKILTDLDPIQTLTKIIIFLLSRLVGFQTKSQRSDHTHQHNSYLRVIRSNKMTEIHTHIYWLKAISRSLSQISYQIIIVRQTKIPNCVDSEIACSTTNKKGKA